VEGKEKRHILTGGLILVTLGVLIILNKTTAFGFDKSWPILLMVIGIGTIAQRARDLGGWFIAVAGVMFLLIYNWQLDIQILSTYIMPVLLILIGVDVLRRYYFKKK
jgi:hypothetical protein